MRISNLYLEMECYVILKLSLLREENICIFLHYTVVAAQRFSAFGDLITRKQNKTNDRVQDFEDCV